MAPTALLEKAVELGDLRGPGLRKASTELDRIDFNGLNGDLVLGQPEDRVLPKTCTTCSYDHANPLWPDGGGSPVQDRDDRPEVLIP